MLRNFFILLATYCVLALGFFLIPIFLCTGLGCGLFLWPAIILSNVAAFLIVGWINQGLKCSINPDRLILVPFIFISVIFLLLCLLAVYQSYQKTYGIYGECLSSECAAKEFFSSEAYMAIPDKLFREEGLNATGYCKLGDDPYALVGSIVHYKNSGEIDRVVDTGEAICFYETKKFQLNEDSKMISTSGSSFFKFRKRFIINYLGQDPNVKKALDVSFAELNS